MSLLLAGVGGVALSFFVANEVQKNQRAMGPAEPDTTVAYRMPHSGVYGDISEITDLIRDPTNIVDIKEDTDLSGVPCYWVYTRNGIPYRTYQNPFLALRTL